MQLIPGPSLFHCPAKKAGLGTRLHDYYDHHDHYFTAHGGGWGYSASSVEAIRFSPDTDILLGGFGLYGGRGTYNAEIKVSKYGGVAMYLTK